MELQLSEALLEGPLQIENLKTCNGHIVHYEHPLQRAGSAKAVYFNELYFHPFEGENDYIELYNAGDSAVDLRHFVLSSLHPDGSVKEQKRLFPQGQLLHAGQYLVLSADPNWIRGRFAETPFQNMVVCPIPALNSDFGILVLHDSLGRLLDSLSYSDKQHAAAIQNPKGIALEKAEESVLSADAIWTSASSSAAYGTPGMRNSQFRGKATSEENWWLDSRRMSPDQDGFEDLLLIRYKQTETEARVVLHITDFSGKLLATLAQGDLLGQEGTYSWDGHCLDGSIVKPGAYCLFIETYTATSNKKSRLSFSVLHR